MGVAYVFLLDMTKEKEASLSYIQETIVKEEKHSQIMVQFTLHAFIACQFFI